MRLLDYINSHLVYTDGPMRSYDQTKEPLKDWAGIEGKQTDPETVIRRHQDCFEAGCNLVCANTYRANCLHFSQDELEVVIRDEISYVKEAHKRSGCIQPTWIGLKLGSLGRRLKPFGDYTFDEAVETFAETVRCGVKYGADYIDIETINDTYETKAAVLAAKENSELPVFVSNYYDTADNQVAGATPEAMIALLEGLRVNAIGVDCDSESRQMLSLAERYISSASVPVLFRARIGCSPLSEENAADGKNDEAWLDIIEKAVRMGVHMVGCGALYVECLKALVKRTKNIPVVPIEKKDISWVSSYTHTVIFGGRPILNAERINPNALEELHIAIRDGDIERIKKEAVLEKEEGAHLLDINVGLPEINEIEFLDKTICAIQSAVDTPLVIDTSDPLAMERALRHYNGKALIDTVNGKEENMRAIFPLAQKYGGMIVCLPIDEDGIPDKAEKRVEIAKRIISKAAEYGIDKKELIFDPLAMTISTNTQAAMETLKAVKMLHELGCLTSLGVSNVSFGLPQRPLLNAAFFLMALDAGLNTGIVNTGAPETMNAYYAYCALHGYDDNCLDYLKYCAKLPKQIMTDEAKKPVIPEAPIISEVPIMPEASENGSTKTENDRNVDFDFEVMTALKDAIIDGMDDEAAELAEKLLEDADPLLLISEAVIPALDFVGKGFEEQEFFLPELLMCADAAQSACDVIKESMAKSGNEGAKKCKVVLATVRGDVHDIGKNIVKVLLENYGFEVIDLGIDVPAETITETILETQAPVCGLSALMTTSVPAMEETIALILEKAPWCRIVVGGAVLNQEYADKIHASYYASSAMGTVRYADEIFNTMV